MYGNLFYKRYDGEPQGEVDDAHLDVGELPPNDVTFDVASGIEWAQICCQICFR
jgi:hypothetical protein